VIDLGRACTLMYHDIVSDADPDSSGFPGPGAAVYKLSMGEFRQHLSSIAAIISKPGSVYEPVLTDCPCILTFDDGGISFGDIATVLDELGWIGHFFFTTDLIGQPHFLTSRDIRDLADRGHVIGSHSCSHPDRMNRLDFATLVHEWKESIAILSDIVGKRVDVASVPGGYYSKTVAQTASMCGIRRLFTSEPLTAVKRVDECLVLGRYAVKRGVTASELARLVSGGRTLHYRAWLGWKKEIFRRMLLEISA
jgi:peptidoglycan/xylan/chitin deacetylase (PgdA/CDA1 family)